MICDVDSAQQAFCLMCNQSYCFISLSEKAQRHTRMQTTHCFLPPRISLLHQQQQQNRRTRSFQQLPYFPRGRKSGWIHTFDLVEILHRMTFLTQRSHLSKLGTGIRSPLACDPPPEAGFVN